MKYFSIFLILGILGTAPLAQARVFFSRSAQASISYSNIYTGTAQLVPSANYEIRYSDDDEACLFLVNDLKLDCKSDRQGNSVTIYLNNAATIGFLGSMLTAASQSSYVPIMTRIVNSVYSGYDDPCKLAYSQAGGVKQLHDPQPESFHVTFSKFGPEVPLHAKDWSR